jgi:hypothetical protein
MDPNACLKEIRILTEAIVNGGDSDMINCERLAELVEALDGWISKGGFLPADWQPKVERTPRPYDH